VDFRLNSIKTKLILLIILVIGAIATFVFIYFPYKFEKQEINAIRNKVNTLAGLSAQSVAPALYFDDKQALEEEITPLIKNPNIEYLVVRTNSDSNYYSSNFEVAEKADYKLTNKIKFGSNQNILKVQVPVVFKEQKLGNLYVGYSLKRLLTEVSYMKKHIAFISLLIFLVGIISIIIMERFITRLLSEMVKAVEKVKAGSLSNRAVIFSKDEIGFLAKSFNEMLDKIEQTNEELELINEELEIRVQDRTIELENALKSLQEENRQRKLIQKALRESEERFRSLFENSTIGIYRSTPSGKILMANPTLIKMLGYDSLEDIQSIENIGTGYLNPSTREKFKNLLKKNDKVLGFEEAWKRKDGSVIYIRESARSVTDEEGNILYYEGSVEDITSKKIIEKELIEAKEKAEASLKLKSDFLAQMSHEIRTPVNSILSYTGLLKDELKNTLPQDLQLSFDMINNGGRRLIRTIDMILNMSELQTGTFEAQKAPVHITQEILKPLIGEFRPIAQSKGLKLEMINKTNKKELIVLADSYSLTQTFANLIDNAIKYTQEGEIGIKIYQDDKKGLNIEVADTGIGISKEFLNNIFDPFTQEEQGYTRKFEGNGLGLALVKNYVKLNGFTISIESEKGEGSVFKINIPKDLIKDTNPQIFEMNEYEQRKQKLI